MCAGNARATAAAGDYGTRNGMVKWVEKRCGMATSEVTWQATVDDLYAIRGRGELVDGQLKVKDGSGFLPARASGEPTPEPGEAIPEIHKQPGEAK